MLCMLDKWHPKVAAALAKKRKTVLSEDLMYLVVPVDFFSPSADRNSGAVSA